MTPQRSRRTAAILLIAAALAIVAVVIVPFFLLNRHYVNGSSKPLRAPTHLLPHLPCERWAGSRIRPR